MPPFAGVHGSTFVCNPCGARLVARAAAITRSSTRPGCRMSVPSSSPSSSLLPSQRHFSTSPRPLTSHTPVLFSQQSKAPIKSNSLRKNLPKSPPANFTLYDVPDIAFWKTRARPPWIRASGVSPADCHSITQEYVELAVAGAGGASRAADWREQLGGKSLLTLYYAAITLMNSAKGDRTYALSWHMLDTLVAYRYLPAVLTTVRFALRTHKLGMPAWRHADSAFLELLRAGLAERTVDPNAATLAGLLAGEFASPVWPPSDRAARDVTALTEAVNLVPLSSPPPPGYPGGHAKGIMRAKSLEWLRLAARMGGEKPDAWDWQVSCASYMALTYGERGDNERQAQIHEYLAKTLDNPEGCYFYAKSLAAGSPERDDLMLRSALTGFAYASKEVAVMYRERATRAAEKGSPDAKHFSIMASEWEAIVRETEPPSQAPRQM